MQPGRGLPHRFNLHLALTDTFFSAPLSTSISVQNGIAAVAWGPWGYKMMVAEVGSAAQVLELGLAKSMRSSHRIAASRHASASSPNQEVHLLQVRFCIPVPRQGMSHPPVG